MRKQGKVMKIKRSFRFAAVFLVLSAVFSSAFAGDSAKGETLFQGSCIECHGADAKGIKDKNAPSLKGQYDWYIVSSLEKFKSGERKNPSGSNYWSALSKADMEDLGAYLSGLK